MASLPPTPKSHFGVAPSVVVLPCTTARPGCSHTIHVFELLDLGLHNARKLFDGMAQRDMFTYNAML
jgi:hypothetical protein